MCSNFQPVSSSFLRSEIGTRGFAGLDVVWKGRKICWQTMRRDDRIRMHARRFRMPSCSILGALGTSPILRFAMLRTLYCTVEADISAIHRRSQNQFFEAWDRPRQHLGQTRLSFLVRQRVGRCLHRLPQLYEIRMPCNILYAPITIICESA